MQYLETMYDTVYAQALTFCEIFENICASQNINRRTSKPRRHVDCPGSPIQNAKYLASYSSECTGINLNLKISNFLITYISRQLPHTKYF